MKIAKPVENKMDLLRSLRNAVQQLGNNYPDFLCFESDDDEITIIKRHYVFLLWEIDEEIRRLYKPEVTK